jgi:lycopene beta-cyclase
LAGKQKKQERLDLAILGCGLSGGLLAYFLRKKRPDLRIALFEERRDPRDGLTWSFHGRDLSAASLEWIRPLLSASWEETSVAFPGLERTFRQTYHSIRSRDFEREISRALGEALHRGAGVADVAADHFVLHSGERIEAAVILDARGASAHPASCGFQKFLGLDLELKSPHGLHGPVLMDARVPQEDGYRFFYLLPWGPKSVLVEDTRYSGSPALDLERIEAGILDYVSARGWGRAEISRRESGVLPIPLQAWPTPELSIGMRGGFFHETTGFSLAVAVSVAETLAKIAEWNAGNVCAALALESDKRARSSAFFRGLNRMMFQAAEPKERWKILEKFYRLPEETISRFYRGELSALDYARILSGRPPVPMKKALSVFLQSESQGGAL